MPDRTVVQKARQHTFIVKDATDAGPASFTLRRPGFMDAITIGRRMTELSGGLQLIDPIADLLVRVRATVESTIEGDLPFDFNNPELNIEGFFAFYDEYLRWINSFRDTGANKSTATPAPAPTGEAETA